MAFLRHIALGALLGLSGAGATEARAQSVGVVESDVLVINPERLFAETELGQSMSAELQAERDELIAMNRKLESQLEAEEKTLTELRAETSPEEFRDLADAFDAKVQDIRRESERRARDLERKRSQAPVTFLRVVEPVLADIMRDADAAVILDSRSVLLSAGVVDITGLAVARIDQEIGDELPERPQPSDEGTANGSSDPATPPRQDDAQQ